MLTIKNEEKARLYKIRNNKRYIIIEIEDIDKS